MRQKNKQEKNKKQMVGSKLRMKKKVLFVIGTAKFNCTKDIQRDIRVLQNTILRIIFNQEILWYVHRTLIHGLEYYSQK